MDSFLYRLTLQPLWKGAMASGISFAVTGFLYYLFISAIGFIGGNGDFAFHAILVTLTAGVTCFFAIYLKCDHSVTETMSHSVGEFWGMRARLGKKTPFIAIELLMLSHIIIAVGLGIYVYLAYPGVIAEYTALFSTDGFTVKDAMMLFMKAFFTLFIEAIFAAVLLLQYRNVRAFAVDGRCHHCRAAFSLSFVRSGGRYTSHHSDTSRKERQVPVAERYEITTEDDVEVSRRKVDTVYKTEYDYYRTDTETTEYKNICRCAICGSVNEKSDFLSISTTTKID